MNDLDGSGGPPALPPPPAPSRRVTGGPSAGRPERVHRRRRAAPSWVAWLWLVAAAGAAVAFAVAGGTAGDGTPIYEGVAAVAFVAAVAGLLANRPPRADGWWVVVVALAGFVTAAVLRVATDLGDATAALEGAWPTLVALAATLVLLAGVAVVLAGTADGTDVDALLDAVTAGLAAFTVAWVLFVEPAQDLGARSEVVVVAGAVRPVLDVVLVVLVLRLAFGRERRLAAPWFALGATAGLLVGDALAALLASGRATWSPTIGETAYVAGFALAATVFLHPTMQRLGAAAAPREPGAVGLRAVLVTLSLAVPVLVLALAEPLDGGATAAVLSASLLLVVLVAWRMARAVRAQADAARQAVARHTRDPLTGLLTRSTFEDAVADALARARAGRRVAVLVADLDRFRAVNDGFGHAVGEEVLSGVAQRLEAVVQPPAVPARIAGDVFALLVPGVGSPTDVDAVTSGLLALGDEPVQTSVGEVYVSLSVGVAVSPPEGISAADLLRNADTALTRAKVLDRGTAAVFDAAMRERAVERIEMQTALRRAVERGEMVVHYQPVVRLATGEVVGFEALVRWRRPDGELIAPTQFLPVAEDTGAIVELGRWVVREAVRQLSVWHATVAGAAGLFVSVNLSPRQLRHPGLASVLEGALAETGVPAAQVWVEVSERVLTDEVGRTRDAFAALRHLGVWLSLDDVGTAYPSLQHLGRLPVDRVKIDRSQVAGLEAGGDGHLMVATLVSMAHSLGMSVVAEGIETFDQRHALVDVGCELGQGFLFSPPLPPDEIPAAVAGRIGRRGGAA